MCQCGLNQFVFVFVFHTTPRRPAIPVVAAALNCTVRHQKCDVTNASYCKCPSSHGNAGRINHRPAKDRPLKPVFRNKHVLVCVRECMRVRVRAFVLVYG